MKNRVLFLALLVLVIISCKKSSVDSSGIKQISYGNSFGQCVGYCKEEMTLSSEKYRTTSSGWNNSVVPRSCERQMDKSVLDSLSKKIDFEGFFEMKEVLGCPDCYDGGAEWVKLEMNSGRTHRVTFEYLNEPSELKGILPDLRIKLRKTPCMTVY